MLRCRSAEIELPLRVWIWVFGPSYSGGDEAVTTAVHGAFR